MNTRLDLILKLAAAETDPRQLDNAQPAFKFAKVKLTDNCNSRCITCDYWKHAYTNELTFDELAALLRALKALGVEELMFTGGEPTMRPELCLVGIAAGLGFRTIGITTNCLSLGREKLQQLLADGLNEIVVSLEGLRSHDAIRGVPGNTRKVMDVLANLTALRRDEGRQVAVKIATTLMSRTVDEVLDVVRVAEEHSAVFFLNLIDRGTYFFRGTSVDLFTIEDKAGLNQLIDALVAIKLRKPALIGNTVSSLEYARRYFDDPRQDRIPCHLGYVGIDIDANGDVYSNCWGLPPVGNIRKQPLAEIVRAPAYASRCRAMYRKECPGCSCGYILNLAYHKASVERDLASGLGEAVWSVGYAGAKVLG